MVTDEMGIKYYDRNLVDKVVRELDVDKSLVERADTGESVKYEAETSLGPRYANLTNKVISEQFEVIRQLADKSSCVIIGRCANYILREQDDVLNVFVYASMEKKIAHIMAARSVPRKEAEKLVKYNDDMLASRYRYVTGADWGGLTWRQRKASLTGCSMPAIC